MRSALLASAAALLLAAVAGCHHHNLARNGCSHCGTHGQGHGHGHAGMAQRHGHGHVGMAQRHSQYSGGPLRNQAQVGNAGAAQYMGGPGPTTGAYAYPYYTVRGPRDFLLDNPPPVGP